MDALRVPIDDDQDDGELVGLRKVGDKVHRNVFPDFGGKWQGLEKTGQPTSTHLRLLANTAFMNKSLNVLTQGGPIETRFESVGSLGYAEVTTQRCFMELKQEGEDIGVSAIEPYMPSKQ